MQRLFFLLISTILLFSCRNQSTKVDEPSKNPFYDQAFEFRTSGESDSAFYYFNKAKDLFIQEKDNFGAGKCLVNMAIISSNKGDYFGGQELSINALHFLNKHNIAHYRTLDANYNNLGIASHQLADYTHAIGFFDQALRFAKDSVDVRIYLNNKARTYQQLKKYGEALKIYELVLQGTSKNEMEYARTLSNIAKTKWLKDSSYNAAPDLLKSLSIRKKENDLFGLNSSYAHLADFYSSKRRDSALLYAEKMFIVATQLNSANDQLEALEKLIKFNPSEKTKQYFDAYKKIDDSVQNARNSAKNQFALIRFETEQHKANNLVLQKDNQAKTYQLIIWISISSLVLFFGIVWYRKRKQQMELEAKDAIQKSQLRTSKKVHDVVANGLYRVMSEMENQAEMDKESVLDRIEDLYEKSRDISYDDPIGDHTPAHTKTVELLKSFATDRIHVAIVGNSPRLWEPVSSTVFYEVEHVLQELMVNMKKHSRSDKVAIRFERNQYRLYIFYSDNGVGMPNGVKPKNGLKNTENRISSIGGIIKFDNNTERGLRIEISFPVA